MKAEAGRDDQVGAAKTGRKSGDAATRAEADVATRTRTKAEVATTSLMEAVVERGNLKLAYQRVMENKGAAGVDALTVAEFKAHLQQHWPAIKGRLLAGTYQPQPIRRVDIPKPQGGVRTLGIPTVVDRLLQQALHRAAPARSSLHRTFRSAFGAVRHFKGLYDKMGDASRKARHSGCFRF